MLGLAKNKSFCPSASTKGRYLSLPSELANSNLLLIRLEGEKLIRAVSTFCVFISYILKIII